MEVNLMKTRFIKNVLLALVFTFITLSGSVAFSSNANASWTFNAQIRDRFIRAIAYSYVNFNYDFYALHDFDGSGIPEILMGKSRENNPLFVTYDVIRYDVMGDRFVIIGSIAETRYLMKDRYSNALIGYYSDSNNGHEFRIYRNYYISNNSLARNTQLAMLRNTPTNVIYDGVNIAPGFYENDMWFGFPYDVNAELYFQQKEIVMRGSYDELIVHDRNGFKYEVAYIAVNSWKPTEFTNRPITFSSNDMFTRTWQMPMFNLIQSKRGPANTVIDRFLLDTSLTKDVYTRFALHDIDGCGIPELLLGVRRGTNISFDVYKYWNQDMRYIGSFNSYDKYLSRFRGSNDIFAFDPVTNPFYHQSAFRISIRNNMLGNDTLLSVYNKDTETYSILRKPNAQGNPVSLSYSEYLSELGGFVINDTVEIRTFCLLMVPPSAPLIMYVKTQGYTVMGR
jgi:hypothetical protein